MKRTLIFKISCLPFLFFSFNILKSQSDSLNPLKTGYAELGIGPNSQNLSLLGFNRQNTFYFGVGAFQTSSKNAYKDAMDSSEFVMKSIALLGGVNVYSQLVPLGIRGEIGYHFPTRHTPDLKQLVTYYFGPYYKHENIRLGAGIAGNIYTSNLGFVQSIANPCVKVSVTF